MMSRFKIYKLIIFVSLLFSIYPSIVRSQTNTLEPGQDGIDRSVYLNSYVHRNGFIVKDIWNDLKYLTGQQDFYETMSFIGLTPELFSGQFNHESPEFTEQWGTSQGADDFFESGEVLGDGRFPVGLSLTSWGIGKIIGSERLTSFGSDLLRLQAINGLFTAALKVGINRTRPNGGPYSYPSGHTSSTFATAGVIYRHFGKYAGIPAFVIAGYVGLSRLQEGKHYLSDVIAGGILGSYLSLKITDRQFRNKSLTVAPVVSQNRSGLSLTLSF